jgi:hypothetical protein
MHEGIWGLDWNHKIPYTEVQEEGAPGFLSTHYPFHELIFTNMVGLIYMKASQHLFEKKANNMQMSKYLQTHIVLDK